MMWTITIKDSDGSYDVSISGIDNLTRFFIAKRRLKFNVVNIERSK